MSSDKLGPGGFVAANVRKSILEDCYASGDADAYFECLLDVVEELDWERPWLEGAEEAAHGSNLTD